MAFGANTLRKSRPPRRRPVVEGMEPRILFSADGLAGLIDPLHVDAHFADAPPLLLLDTHDTHTAPQSTPTPQPASAPLQPIELVVIDTRLADYQSLIDDIQSRSDPHALFEIIVLNQEVNGISQISELLAQRHDVSALHILSHGQDGGVQLGASWVDGQTLQQQSMALLQWRASLNADADILLYGCDVTAGSAGYVFIQELARLTGADVAASSNLTGDAALGGDWVLEERTGEIAANIVLSEAMRNAWSGTLANITVTNTGDSAVIGSGSLRAAILESNASTAVDDNIVFAIPGLGVHTITVGATMSGSFSSM